MTNLVDKATNGVDDEYHGDSMLMVMARKIKEKLTPKRVQDKIEELLSDRELDKRALAWMKVYDELMKTSSLLRRCTPDVHTRNAAGERESKFSDKMWDDKIKLEQKVKKFEIALFKAHDKNEWEKLHELAHSLGGKEQPPKPEKSSGSKDSGEASGSAS